MIKRDTFPVEKGIPIPPINFGRHLHYPLRDMDIEDSFFVAIEPFDLKEAQSREKRILGCGRDKRMAPKKFTVRIVDGGVRCWRIE